MAVDAKFDHLVVLMFENRSFDNLLGYLYSAEEKPTPADFDGLQARPYTCLDSDGTAVPAYAFTDTDVRAAMSRPDPDPGESFVHVTRQVALDANGAATMQGFIADYASELAAHRRRDVNPRAIMGCFPPAAVPVLSTLAREFAVSDRWFAPVPSQTFANRSFLHSGQSHGYVDNSDYVKWLGNDAITVFELLSAKGHDWRVYFDSTDVVSATWSLHAGLRQNGFRGHFLHFDRFDADCRSGDLPAYTFIEPRLFFDHNDMHPPSPINAVVHSSITAGEALLASVYRSLRASPRWSRTLFVVLTDEHGGCFDHVPPGRATPPRPAATGNEHGFAFDRYGVRVPAILVSPWILRGAVVRPPGETPFDHTSIIRTLCDRFQLDGPLTDRVRAAPSLMSVLDAPEARDDLVEVTPRPTLVERTLVEPSEDRHSGIAALKMAAQRETLERALAPSGAPSVGCGCDVAFDARAAFERLARDVAALVDRSDELAETSRAPDTTAPSAFAALAVRDGKGPPSSTRGGFASLLGERPAPSGIGAIEGLLRASRDRVQSDGFNRIVGGAATSAYPSCCVIGDASRFFCSGVLVRPRVILTAGHCGATITRALIGASSVDAPDEGAMLRVREVVRHPGYHPATHSHDISLILLDADAPVAPIEIAEQAALATADTVVIVGFGRNDPNRPQGFGTKRKVTVPIAAIRRAATDDLAAAADRFGFFPDSEFVAGRKFLGQDSCNGDSGGPAYTVGADGARLAGVTSRATREAQSNCGDGGIYVRPDAYRDWFVSVLAARSLPW